MVRGPLRSAMIPAGLVAVQVARALWSGKIYTLTKVFIASAGVVLVSNSHAHSNPVYDLDVFLVKSQECPYT